MSARGPDLSLGKGLKVRSKGGLGPGGPGGVRPVPQSRRSVYLHNNKLADAGLPDNMFNGSSNVEILILSSNFLRHVPKHLPPALYKLHLKVGDREGRWGWRQTRGRSPTAEGEAPPS